MSARHQGGTVHYKSKRVDSSGLSARSGALRCYGPRLSVDDGSLERWLAERYGLYVVDEHKRALRTRIHHRPWPLQPAGAHDRAAHDGAAARARARLRSGHHYSARQDTLIWALELA